MIGRLSLSQASMVMRSSAVVDRLPSAGSHAGQYSPTRSSATKRDELGIVSTLGTCPSILLQALPTLHVLQAKQTAAYTLPKQARKPLQLASRKRSGEVSWTPQRNATVSFDNARLASHDQTLASIDNACIPHCAARPRRLALSLAVQPLPHRILSHHHCTASDQRTTPCSGNAMRCHQRRLIVVSPPTHVSSCLPSCCAAQVKGWQKYNRASSYVAILVQVRSLHCHQGCRTAAHTPQPCHGARLTSPAVPSQLVSGSQPTISRFSSSSGLGQDWEKGKGNPGKQA